MSAEQKIHFFFNNVKPTIKDRTLLKKHIILIFSNEGIALSSLNYIFCTDKFLLGINRSYLNHDDYTDIITFNLSENLVVEGEIYISIDRVKENAQLFRRNFNEEIRRVIFHGALHLCGYKDNTASQKKQMREREIYYLKKAGLIVSRE
jgi:rRNA maturation RNase YbeY